MIDANHAYDPPAAIALARRVEQHDIFWFEEPVSPLDIEGYLAVKGASSIPIAGGECEYTRFGFEPLLRRRAVDYAQPDLCACGGVSEGLKNLAPRLVPIRDEHGVELFYNVAVTPWCHVTPDFQVVTPARDRVETSVVVGLRAKFDF